MTDYRIIFDGGSHGNGSEDSVGYGSYQLSTRTGRSEIKRLDFGKGVTNNEAEYRALLAALEDLADRLDGRSGFTLTIQGDSRLVLNQVEGLWKTNSRNLIELRDNIRAILPTFVEVEFVWHPREESVRILGH